MQSYCFNPSQVAGIQEDLKHITNQFRNWLDGAYATPELWKSFLDQFNRHSFLLIGPNEPGYPTTQAQAEMFFNGDSIVVREWTTEAGTGIHIAGGDIIAREAI